MSQPALIRAPELKIIDVDLVRLMPQRPKKQIVSPTEQPEEKPPENTSRLSERDVATPKETIRRGDPGAGTVAKAVTPPSTPTKKTMPEKARQQKTSSSNNQTKSLGRTTSNSRLDLSTDYGLLSDLSKQAEQSQKSVQQADNIPQPFSRAPGSSAQIFGFHGSLDHLPNVTDGDITLLNAKADKFAVFVRRVAIRVFNLLKQYGWDYLSGRDFVSLNRFGTIVATLDPAGNFVALQVTTSSGNTSFDRVLERSVTEGASDPNPPPAAKAADGNYRFIFQARAWTQFHPGGRAPGGRPVPPQERRWLMLRTGLE